MNYFLYRSVLCSKNGNFITAQNHPPIAFLSSACIRYLSSDTNQHPFTVSYLINTYGFSPECALSISKSVSFENPEKPNLVLSFFKNLGFSMTQISLMVKKFPRTLLVKPEKNIFPKVEFFISKGASTLDVTRIFVYHPWLLKRSLENKLVPSFNFFRDLHQSDEKALASIKRYPSILDRRLEADVVPNINTLREYGVPPSNILLLVHYHPKKICIEVGKFKKIVEEVKQMGFDPSKSQFVLAIIALRGQSKSFWNRKVNAYKLWGWSDEDIHRAFRKNPWCMTISEDKLMAVMDFYVNKMGLDSSLVAHRPLLVSLSLNKRLIPRGSVIQLVSSKGLMKVDASITTLFECTEKSFMDKCINRYEEAPQLLKLYKEKLNLSTES